MSWWVEANAFLDPIFALLGKAGAAFGLIYGGYKWIMKKIKPAENFRNLSSEEREIFYKVYSKLSEAKGLVLRDGRVKNEALTLFWEARDQARLELPDDIQEYTEKLREAANRAFSINDSYLYPANREGLPVGEERSRKVEEHEQHLSIIEDAKPYEIFARYMKVKIS